MRQMKAVICREFSGPDRLEIGEAPEPMPAADEILIDVHAASVTYMDRLLVSGGYQMRPPTPFVPGTEAAGVVVGLGDKVTRFRVGDRVACLAATASVGPRVRSSDQDGEILPFASLRLGHLLERGIERCIRARIVAELLRRVAGERETPARGRRDGRSARALNGNAVGTERPPCFH